MGEFKKGLYKTGIICYHKNMRRITFFEQPKTIRKEGLLIFILAGFVFIITPAVSLFVITRGEQSALYNSLSRLAWSENLFAPIFICILLNMFTFAFAEVLALKKIGFVKPMKIIFLTLTAVVFVAGVVGLSIPCRFTNDPHDVALRDAHISVSMSSFISIFVVVLLITAAVWFFNRRLALLATLVDVFTILCGLFALYQLRDPTSFVVTSAPAQVCILTLYNISMAAHYFGAFIFPHFPKK